MAKKYYLQIKSIGDIQHNDDYLFFAYGNLGYVYNMLNVPDSAMLYAQQAYAMAVKTQSENIGWQLLWLADIELKLHNKNLALDYYKMAIDAIKKSYGESRALSKCYWGLADFYRTYSMNDSAIYYAHLSLNTSRGLPYMKGISNASLMLAAIYDSLHQSDNELKYLKTFI
jgi:hypothetical protein